MVWAQPSVLGSVTCFYSKIAQSLVPPSESRSPTFTSFPNSRSASYAKRYELFCRRLMSKDITSPQPSYWQSRFWLGGVYCQPAEDLTFEKFARSLVAHVVLISGKMISHEIHFDLVAWP